MKRYLLLIAALGLAACGKWLDEPRPMGQTDERDLYNSEQGFRNVLTGAYLSISGNQLYGMDMNLVYPELMARQWTAPDNTAAAAARNWHYDNVDVKASMESSYTRYYSTIVNLNSLLGKIDEKRELFTLDNFNMVKGEALGLRGFLHFDVLRLWGPTPTENGVPVEGLMEETSIPYVSEVTRTLSKLSRKPYKEVLAKIEADLLAAEKLLVNDPITKWTKTELASPSSQMTVQLGDDYYYYRHTRMNLYAVKATLARYYMWVRDYDKAKQYAKDVIDAVVTDKGDKVFQLADNAYIQRGELSFEPEHIFSLFSQDIENGMRGIYRANGTIQQTDQSVINNMYVFGGDDIRKASTYWTTAKGSNTIDYYVFKKFIRPEAETTGYVAKYIPLIRLSEMYAIGGECIAQADNFDQAAFAEWYTPYFTARGLELDILDAIASKEDAMSIMEYDYRIEFFGEGQMFHRIKRLGQTVLNFPEEGFDHQNIQNYVVPQPDNQIMFEKP